MVKSMSKKERVSTKSLDQEMARILCSPRQLSDKELHDIGKQIFSNDVTRIVAEGRER